MVLPPLTKGSDGPISAPKIKIKTIKLPLLRAPILEGLDEKRR